MKTITLDYDEYLTTQKEIELLSKSKLGVVCLKASIGTGYLKQYFTIDSVNDFSEVLRENISKYNSVEILLLEEKVYELEKENSELKKRISERKRWWKI